MGRDPDAQGMLLERPPGWLHSFTSCTMSTCAEPATWVTVRGSGPAVWAEENKTGGH